MMNQEQIKEIIVVALNNGYIKKYPEIEKLAEDIAKFEKAYRDEFEK